MRKWPCILAVTGIAACDRGNSASVTQQALTKPPNFATPDLSTPDRAVRSWWAVKDTADAYAYRTYIANSDVIPGSREQRAAVASITIGAANTNVIAPERPTRESYSREILKVKQESESRAVVTARVRNVTPIPPGAVASEYQATARAEGEVYRYVVEKDATGWKISQIFTKSYSGEWRPQFGSSTPSVSTWVTP